MPSAHWLKKMPSLRCCGGIPATRKKNASIPPYHYVRTTPYNQYHDLLICGGEDHPTGLPDTPEEYRYEQLESWAHNRFPVEQILYRWSGRCWSPWTDWLSLAAILRPVLFTLLQAIQAMAWTHGTIAGDAHYRPGTGP
jgi:hypothetical protein